MQRLHHRCTAARMPVQRSLPCARRVGQQCSPRRSRLDDLTCRAGESKDDEDDTGVMVAGVLKQGVKAIANTIEGLTDFAVKYVPEGTDRETVNLAVKALAIVGVIGIVNSVLSFAFTLGAIALVAFVAVGVFGIDVEDVLASAKKKK